MKIENISEGQIFKNYKELCKELEMPVKSSNSKKAQFSELARHCKFVKVGHSIHIHEVYDQIVDKVETRGRKSEYKNLSAEELGLSSEWDYESNSLKPNEIIYSSKQKVYWKCKKCKYKWKSTLITKIKNVNDCPMCAASKGEKRIAKFLNEHDIDFINQYKFKDLLGINGYPLKFDFGIFNSKDELINLIEYDGEFHYKEKATDLESHLTIVEHDERKNIYCKENNLNLIRIPYFLYEVIDQILALEFNIKGYEDSLIKKPKRGIIGYYQYKIRKMEEGK
ncbi:zinc-ribbon domain-containing protein [Priestia aryabhattai]|uniref:zinc-ribbon domain-containing protein n=1 Tax=Priestia aryabhattai TaxID=412384 RepID=UPI0015F4BDDE|nr:zinc-ribbon domain-containing protein [Priestia aryabhattai]